MLTKNQEEVFNANKVKEKRNEDVVFEKTLLEYLPTKS